MSAGNFQSRPVTARTRRITSYNVCYTKLLRFANRQSLLHNLCVITSYSIHYTKLYEDLGLLGKPTAARAPVQVSEPDNDDIDQMLSRLEQGA